MSMTEQEIRADERAKLAATLSTMRPFVMDAESVGVAFAIQYITSVRPPPKPPASAAWRWYPVDYQLRADPKAPPKPVPMPDVPHLERQFGQFIKNAMAMMAALETLERSQAFLNEAAQKGWP